MAATKRCMGIESWGEEGGKKKHLAALCVLYLKGEESFFFLAGEG